MHIIFNNQIINVRIVDYSCKKFVNSKGVMNIKFKKQFINLYKIQRIMVLIILFFITT